jgi:hypothetical protein
MTGGCTVSSLGDFISLLLVFCQRFFLLAGVLIELVERSEEIIFFSQQTWELLDTGYRGFEGHKCRYQKEAAHRLPSQIPSD